VDEIRNAKDKEESVCGEDMSGMILVEER